MTKKHAFVTGASSGIGRAFALRLAADGYQVTALGRDRARLKALLSELGSGARSISADLSTPAGQNAALKALKARHYDLLINNAGYGLQGRFDQLPLTGQLAMLNVNVQALVRLSHAFLQQAEPGDALVNLASALAFMPMPSMALYSASKALVSSFSESLWQEQKSRGVYVMSLAPGITETRFFDKTKAGKSQAPALMTQSPEQVVDRAMRALKARRQPLVRSGAMNSVFGLMTRFMSHKAVVSMMGSDAKV